MPVMLKARSAGIHQRNEDAVTDFSRLQLCCSSFQMVENPLIGAVWVDAVCRVGSPGLASVFLSTLLTAAKGPSLVPLSHDHQPSIQILTCTISRILLTKNNEMKIFPWANNSFCARLRRHNYSQHLWCFFNVYINTLLLKLESQRHLVPGRK